MPGLIHGDRDADPNGAGKERFGHGKDVWPKPPARNMGFAVAETQHEVKEAVADGKMS